MVNIKVFICVLSCTAIVLTSVQAQLADIARSARAEAEMVVRRRNMASLARSSTTGPIAYRLDPPMTAFGFAAGGPSSRSRLSSAAKFSKVHGARTVPPAYSDASRVFQITSNLYLQRTGTGLGTTGEASSPAVAAGFREALAGICPLPIICNPWDPYRHPRGRCNNLFFPYQGSEFTPQPRLLPPAYEDFFEKPRLHSVSGGLLPSPRHISNMVHQGLGMEIPEFGITLFLMQWGQFTDHDIVLTPIATETNGDPLICAVAGLAVPPPLDPECFNIRINAPPPDPFFPPAYIWMNFVRSVSAISSSCIPGPRQHVNKITSYIDASNVYGSTEEEQALLRVPLGVPKGQLNSIKTTSLARIVCRNTNTPIIQARIFHKVGFGNPMVNCLTLPDIDFSLWSGFRSPRGAGFPGPTISPPMSPLSAFKFQRPPKFLVPNIPTGKGVGKPPIPKVPIKGHKL